MNVGHLIEIIFHLNYFMSVCVSCGGENKIVRELQYFFLQCSSVHNVTGTLSQVYMYTITLFGAMITSTTVFL